MKRFVLAFAIAGLMSVSVLAGDVPTNRVANLWTRNQNYENGGLPQIPGCGQDAQD